MYTLAMQPSVPHIQTQNHNSRGSVLQDVSGTPQAGQMLLASPSSLSPNKRPKLSLQTSSVPVAVGKSSTALSVTMSALGASSPTVRNTFNNAYDIPLRPSPVGISPISNNWPKPMTTKREERPYEVPLSVRGILKNTPCIPSLRRSALSGTRSSSPRAGRRVFFPAVKRVSYRSPLDEEIKTIKFIARHSDLPSEDESEVGPETNSSSIPKTDSPTLDDAASGSEITEESISARTSDTAPVASGGGRYRSPLLKHAKRKRKPREWRWTIGPLEETGEEDERKGAASPAPPFPESSTRPELTIDTSSSSEVPEDEEFEVRKTPFPFESVKEGEQPD